MLLFNEVIRISQEPVVLFWLTPGVQWQIFPDRNGWPEAGACGRPALRLSHQQRRHPPRAVEPQERAAPQPSPRYGSAASPCSPLCSWAEQAAQETSRSEEQEVWVGGAEVSAWIWEDEGGWWCITPWALGMNGVSVPGLKETLISDLINVISEACSLCIGFLLLVRMQRRYPIFYIIFRLSYHSVNKLFFFTDGLSGTVADCWNIASGHKGIG